MAARKDASRSGSGRRRLGRGLSSLISSPVPIASDAATESGGAMTEPKPAGPDLEGHAQAAEPEIRFILADEIRPNPNQPRQHFDEQALDALAASIKTAGLMQPIVVRPRDDGGYQLIVGERRWRAARKIGLRRVPAVIRRIDDRAAAEWALIENVQREDLNPLERAEAFRHLTYDFGLTHQEAAERVGLNRSTVSNLMRLLDLDEFTKQQVRAGHLGAAQARLLLSITNVEAREQLATLAIREGWTVRMLERRAAALSSPRTTRPSRPTTAAPAHRHDLERRLGDHLGTKVQIQPGKRKGSGRLVIEFYSLDQFDGLMQKLGFKTEDL